MGAVFARFRPKEPLVSLVPLPALRPGARVLMVEFGPPFLEGRFVRLCDNGWEMEVEHDEDGGGFDFWPIASVRVAS